MPAAVMHKRDIVERFPRLAQGPRPLQTCQPLLSSLARPPSAGGHEVQPAMIQAKFMSRAAPHANPAAAYTCRGLIPIYLVAKGAVA